MRKMRLIQSLSHVKEANPLLIKIISIMGVISTLAIFGGIMAIVYNANSPTEMNLLGMKISTGHVGVAFVGLGVICMFFVIKEVLKAERELAKLPPEK